MNSGINHYKENERAVCNDWLIVHILASIPQSHPWRCSTGRQCGTIIIVDMNCQNGDWVDKD